MQTNGNNKIANFAKEWSYKDLLNGQGTYPTMGLDSCNAGFTK